ncbi:YbaB/EbfC family nucleoid-associated protein [Actinoplanes sp. NPDC049265]|uniref:YbaB/EbfC family nucleoid-associated protein n=1 Tax=Actinoplanes sp. NPDC049265 TaxID=3363902 RepID=UPI00371CE7FB
MGSSDFDAMMDQAREMQDYAYVMQARAEQTEIVGTAASGAVAIAVTTAGSFQSVRIDPEVLDQGQGEVEHAVLDALRDVAAQMQRLGQERMNGLQELLDSMTE